MQIHRPDLIVMNYDDAQWTLLVAEWMRSQARRYLEVKRIDGANDHGLDVVGYTDSKKLEGIWDNNQCKHYRTSISRGRGLTDVGKIVYWSFKGEFASPRKSNFLAPKGPSGPLRRLLDNPSKLKAALLEDWDACCTNEITKAGAPLTEVLLAYIDKFDFTIFGWTSIDELLQDLKQTTYYSARFGGDIPPPPPGVAPAIPQTRESTYIRQLLDVYGEDLGRHLSSHDDLPGEDETCKDFQLQRERFFEMEEFSHYYRDQTPPRTIEDFVEEVFDGVQPVCALEYHKSRIRLNHTMAQAAISPTKSILEPRAKGKVKQGACHHLANFRRLTWKRG